MTMEGAHFQVKYLKGAMYNQNDLIGYTMPYMTREAMWRENT
jgi:hypothetical protein